MWSTKRSPVSRSNRTILRREQLEGRVVPAIFTVNVTTDSHDANEGDGLALDAAGKTSFRAAVEEANKLRMLNLGADHTINFAATVFGMPKQISLLTKRIGITANLTINGPGMNNLTVTRPGDHTVPYGLLDVDTSSTTSIKNLRFADGYTTALHGGGIYNQGTLTLDLCRIENCRGNVGGGIANEKSLTLLRSVVGNNTANDGGGIHCAANSNCVTNISASTIAFNRAIGANGNGGGKGGGMVVLALASVIINGNSTISSNQALGAGSFGGGFYNSGGSVSMTGGSVHDNFSASHGGAFFDSTGTTTLSFVTIAYNHAVGQGGAFRASNGSLTLSNCTFDSNSAWYAPKIVVVGYTPVTLMNCTGITTADILPYRN